MPYQYYGPKFTVSGFRGSRVVGAYFLGLLGLGLLEILSLFLQYVGWQGFLHPAHSTLSFLFGSGPRSFPQVLNDIYDSIIRWGSPRPWFQYLLPRWSSKYGKGVPVKKCGFGV